MQPATMPQPQCALAIEQDRAHGFAREPMQAGNDSPCRIKPTNAIPCIGNPDPARLGLRKGKRGVVDALDASTGFGDSHEHPGLGAAHPKPVPLQTHPDAAIVRRQESQHESTREGVKVVAFVDETLTIEA